MTLICARPEFVVGTNQHLAFPQLLAQWIDYKGTTHGFSVRGNRGDPVVAAARAKAFEDAIAFFKKHLA